MIVIMGNPDYLSFVEVSFGPGNRYTEGKNFLEASQKSITNRLQSPQVSPTKFISLGYSWYWGMTMNDVCLCHLGSGSWERDRLKWVEVGVKFQRARNPRSWFQAGSIMATNPGICAGENLYRLWGAGWGNDMERGPEPRLEEPQLHFLWT